MLTLPQLERHLFAAADVRDAKLFGEVQVRTRLRYRDTVDGDFDPYKYKDKVRALIDEHITVLDLSQKIAPVRITDIDFQARLSGVSTERAKASEMEHAIRRHIREHRDEDPVYYGKLSDRVDENIEKLEERWEQQVLEFGALVDEIAAGQADADDTGLDAATELPFRNQMAELVASSAPDADERLTALTRSLVDRIRADIAIVGFWENNVKQDVMCRTVKRMLDESDLFLYDDLDRLAVDVVDLAKANRHKLGRA